MKRWMLVAEPEILLDRAAHAAALEWNAAWVYDRSNRYWTRASAFRAGADLVLLSNSDKHFDTVMTALVAADSGGLIRKDLESETFRRLVRASQHP